MSTVSCSLFVALISILSISNFAHASENVVGVGAVLSDPADFPSTCYLQIEEDDGAIEMHNSCSGTLIGPHTIASAGHCFSKYFSLNRSRVDIRCGGVSMSRVTNVQLPAESDWVEDQDGTAVPRTTKDVAVITLARDTTLPTVQVAKNYEDVFGPDFTEHGFDLKPGTTCYLAGFGINPRGGTGKLYTASLEKMSVVFKDGAVQLTELDHLRMKTSADHGDSGGSLICEGADHIKTLIGVTVSIARDRTYNYFAPTWSNHL